MNTKQLDAEIRTRIDQFLVSISALVRQAAVEAVREALGAGGPQSARTPRRGQAGTRKATGAGSASIATAPRSAVPKGKSAASKPATAKPGRRARRSSADVEAVAAKVLAYVKAKPGQRLEEIGRGLRVETAGLKLPIQGLLAASALRTEGQKRGTRYFDGGKGSSAKPKVVAGKGTGRKAGTRAVGKAMKKIAVRPAIPSGSRAGTPGERARGATAPAETVAAM